MAHVGARVDHPGWVVANAAPSVPLESSKLKFQVTRYIIIFRRKSKERIQHTPVKIMNEDLESSPVLETSDLDFSYPDIGML